jgi:hypothetical protein
VEGSKRLVAFGRLDGRSLSEPGRFFDSDAILMWGYGNEWNCEQYAFVVVRVYGNGCEGSRIDFGGKWYSEES